MEASTWKPARWLSHTAAPGNSTGKNVDHGNWWIKDRMAKCTTAPDDTGLQQRHANNKNSKEKRSKKRKKYLQPSLLAVHPEILGSAGVISIPVSPSAGVGGVVCIPLHSP
jgi:hypothetical protein